MLLLMFDTHKKLVLKFLANTIIVLVLLSGSSAHAALKYYQYNGNLPFIEMMLNMMTVMGVLDKVPVDYMSDIASNRYNNYYSNAHGFGPTSPYNNGNAGVNGPWSQITPAPSANCKSILCGYKPQTLNGLWVAKNGEMLGINQYKLLWSDGGQRYLVGLIKAKNGLMLINLKGSATPVQYQYKLSNNMLATRDKNGLVKLFKKVRSNRAF